MNEEGLLRQADAFEALERVEDVEAALDLEILPDGRVHAERASAREFLRDRMRAAEVLPTAPGWTVIRSRRGHPPRSSRLGSPREVVAAGILEGDGLPVVDVVSFLASGSQTGVLTVRSETVRTVYLDRGDVVWASASDPLERVGPFLAGRGRLTRAQLQAALRDGPSGVTRACVERGYLSPEEVEPLLSAYVLERFEALLRSERGMWAFARLDPAPLEESVLRRAAQGFLVEALRRIDELRVYHQRLRPDATYVRAAERLDEAEAIGGTGDLDLERHCARVLEALSTPSDLPELMRRTGLGPYEVARALYHLDRASAVQRGRPPRRNSRPPGPRLDPKEVIHVYGLAFEEMRAEADDAGQAGALWSVLERFLAKEAGGRFGGLRFDAEGQLDAGALLARYEAASASADDLDEVLGELLSYALKEIGRLLGRRRGDDLARRVRLIHSMLRAP